MEAMNFGSDEFKKQILGDEGLLPSQDSSDYEILTPLDDEQDPHQEFESIISNSPVIPSSSKGVKTIIRDASALAKQGNQDKAEEMNESLCEIITDYNKKYGTDLQIDFSNISKTLVNVSDPKKTRVLELYLSQVFQSIRPVIYLHMISKLALLVDYLLDPQRLMDGTLSVPDLWVATEKLINYVQQLELLKDEILIKGADLELQKIGEQEQERLKSGMGEEDQKTIDEFMSLFKKDNGL